jgi:GTPase
MPDLKTVTQPTTADPAHRCGFVAIIGAPNAGKSTLVNTLVGAKVSIVSHKVQTTRVPIRGIAMAGHAQLILVDTPGIFQPRRRLDRAMVDAAWGGAGDADRIVLLVDAAKGIDADTKAIVERLTQTQIPIVLALNKLDRLDSTGRLLDLTAALTGRLTFEKTFMISALTGDGVGDLKAYLAEKVPVGPWHYPEDDLSDAPLRLLAAELTREKIYKYLHDELPYSITVETSQWTDLKKKGVRIEQTIFVERDSQKRIALGHKGETIKKISMESRHDLSEILERTVHLFVFVKVRENWADDPERYREMGLQFPKG